MYVAALALFGLSLAGPPALPDVDESPPSVDPAPSEEPPTQDAPGPSDAPPAADAPTEDAPASEDAPAEGAPVEDDAIPVAPPADSGDGGDDEDDEDDAGDAGDAGTGGAAAGGAAAGGAAAGGGAPGGAAGSGSGAAAPTAPAPQVPSPAPAPVQTPSGGTGPQQPSSAPASSAQAEPSGPVEGPAEPSEADSNAAAGDDEEAEQKEDEPKKKLGGFRLFRIGIAPKIGYTHGTSQKDGLFDREKSIEDSIDNMAVTTSGAGDLGQTQFGGFAWGAVLDAEIVGINVWLDFHKFFRPGGMWSLLLGYDHEFGFGERLRLDVGVGGGLNQVFLGKVLDGLYYDQDNPEAVNIGTLGVEGRAMVDLHIKLVGPLYTGPYAMVGYHYLWSANVDEVTAEKGLHYSAGWSLRLDFAAPKLLGRNK